MEIILVLASLASIVALAGIVYPFRPFKKRRYAVYSLVGCFVLIGVTTPSPDAVAPPVEAAKQTQASGNILKVPSDPNAKYFVTGIKSRTDEMLEVSTTRKGPSGTSYSIRLVQCEPRRFGYIADAETKSALVRDPSPAMSELVSGSISDVIAEHACMTKHGELDAKVESKRMLAEKQAVDQTTSEPELSQEELNQQKIGEAKENLLRFTKSNDWYAAYYNLEILKDLGAELGSLSSEIESIVLAGVKPLPASDFEGNLKGYRILAALKPTNERYAQKVAHYSEKKASTKKVGTSTNTLKKKTTYASYSGNVIRGDYFGCVTRETLDEFIGAAVKNDYRHMQALSGSFCTALRGREYSIVDRGWMQSQIRVYVEGGSLLLWTVSEAIR